MLAAPNWTAADIQPGDTLKVQNLDAVIATVTDSTHITLAEPWTGTTLAAAAYRIRYQPDGSRYSAAVRDLIAQLGGGSVAALQALTGAANKIPYFLSASTMALADFKDWAISFLSLTPAANKLAYFDTPTSAALTDLTAAGRAVIGAPSAGAQRTAIGAGDVSGPASSVVGRIATYTDTTGKVLSDGGILAANVYQKSNILGTVSQSAGVPTGAVIERGSNASGNYVKYADGTLITYGLAIINASTAAGSSTSPSIPQPAVFVGGAKTMCQATYYTASSGSGSALYTVAFGASFTNDSSVTGYQFLNCGKTLANFPDFTIGASAAASLLINFITVGKWF